MPHIMAVLAAALRDAMSQTLKMQALCAWRVSVFPLVHVIAHPNLYKDDVYVTFFCNGNFSPYYVGGIISNSL